MYIYDHIQSNLSTTATHATASSGCCKVMTAMERSQIYSKTAVWRYWKLAVIWRWLLLRGDRSWRFHCIRNSYPTIFRTSSNLHLLIYSL